METRNSVVDFFETGKTRGIYFKPPKTGNFLATHGKFCTFEFRHLCASDIY